LDRAPLALNSHFHAVARIAFVFLAQLAAVLIIAATFVLLVDPVLIIGVMTLMMLLRMESRRPKNKQCDKTLCDETRRSETWRNETWRNEAWRNEAWRNATSGDEIGLHAVSPVLELPRLVARASRHRGASCAAHHFRPSIPVRNFGSRTFRLPVMRPGRPYTADHTAFVYLMDANGAYLGFFRPVRRTSGSPALPVRIKRRHRRDNGCGGKSDFTFR
jgi:hypothetical protein